MRYLCLLLAAWLALPAMADEIVIYRCTDTSGHLTVQNAPCPKGSHSDKKIMQAVATVPMGVPTPAAPNHVAESVASAATAGAQADAPLVQGSAQTNSPDAAVAVLGNEEATGPRLPPPPIFQCLTYEGDSYITEDTEPARRCMPLRTVGLDGNPMSGAGQACDMVTDRCARVADEGLCAAWKKRLGETEVAWRFGRSENLEKNRIEFERVQRILTESDCPR